MTARETSSTSGSLTTAPRRLGFSAGSDATATCNPPAPRARPRHRPAARHQPSRQLDLARQLLHDPDSASIEDRAAACLILLRPNRRQDRHPHHRRPPDPWRRHLPAARRRAAAAPPAAQRAARRAPRRQAVRDSERPGRPSVVVHRQERRHPPASRLARATHAQARDHRPRESEHRPAAPRLDHPTSRVREPHRHQHQHRDPLGRTRRGRLEPLRRRPEVTPTGQEWLSGPVRRPASRSRATDPWPARA